MESLRIELSDKQDQLDALSAQMTDDTIRAEQTEAELTRLQQELQQQQQQMHDLQQEHAYVLSPSNSRQVGPVNHLSVEGENEGESM